MKLIKEFYAKEIIMSAISAKTFLTVLSDTNITCEIWGSHGGEDVLLGYNAVQTLQPWRWRPYVSTKRSYLPASLHGVTTQKKNIVINIVRIHRMEAQCIETKVCSLVHGPLHFYCTSTQRSRTDFCVCKSYFLDFVHRLYLNKIYNVSEAGSTSVFR
jgi:hypothetical protein